jgi:hypothetical protein
MFGKKTINTNCLNMKQFRLLSCLIFLSVGKSFLEFKMFNVLGV